MYKAKNYQYVYSVSDFSKAMVKNHLTLYQGYVQNTNQLLNKSVQMESSQTLEYGALKRRLGWEFSGMRLHEYYFGNLGGRYDQPPKSDFTDWLEHCFGDVAKWKEDFIATGLIRGVGWAVLCRDNHTGKLMNIWIHGHDGGQLAGCQPLLVMDVWEHAYLMDYELNREAYIQAFLRNVNWAVVYERFQRFGV